MLLLKDQNKIFYVGEMEIIKSMLKNADHTNYLFFMCARSH